MPPWPQMRLEPANLLLRVDGAPFSRRRRRNGASESLPSLPQAYSVKWTTAASATSAIQNSKGATAATLILVIGSPS